MEKILSRLFLLKKEAPRGRRLTKKAGSPSPNGGIGKQIYDFKLAKDALGIAPQGV